MILEAIVSTLSATGEMNFAPMGIHIPSSWDKKVPPEMIILRPYPQSHTYTNLRATGQGVVNFIENVLLFVETALFSTRPPYKPSKCVRPPSLQEANELWEFRVQSFDSQEPALVEASIENRVIQGSFSGFCRAHGAVLEAAIAATRWERLSKDKIPDAWPEWLALVEKTGGPLEWQAMNKVAEFLRDKGVRVTMRGGLINEKNLNSGRTGCLGQCF